MTGRLSGKVAIITGSGTGIGEAIAHKFAREGAHVVINGLPDDPVEDVASSIKSAGGEAVAQPADISQEAQAIACVQAAVDQFGRLDVLINNAAINLALAETQNYPLTEFDRMIAANIRSVFLMTKHALPHLQASRGNIVSNGSEGGFNGSPTITPYGGTKAWIHAFMKGVAIEQAKYGVRANCVCPGPIDTAWTYAETGPMEKSFEGNLIAATPLARRGTPEEVANVFAFLASDEASYVTGALWLVDGGITPAHGAVGTQTPSELRSQPKGVLPLRHSLDGNKNKHIVRAL